MREIDYSLIVILPPVILVSCTWFVLYLIKIFDEAREKRLKRWVVANLFAEIIKKNPENHGETRWLLKDLDLADESEIFTKVVHDFLILATVLIAGVAIIFLQILLLDVSYSCEQNGNTKDCFETPGFDGFEERMDEFEFKPLWDKKTFNKTFNRHPIDCNSAAFQNGTVRVICYRIVFNFGLAAGASYGGFKLAMAVLNMATTLMLMVKKKRTVCGIRTIVLLVYMCITVGFIAIEGSTLRDSFMSDNLAVMFQMFVAIVTVLVFMLKINWNDLVALKAGENEQAPGSERSRRYRTGTNVVHPVSSQTDDEVDDLYPV